MPRVSKIILVLAIVIIPACVVLSDPLLKLNWFNPIKCMYKKLVSWHSRVQTCSCDANLKRLNIRQFDKRLLTTDQPLETSVTMTLFSQQLWSETSEMHISVYSRNMATINQEHAPSFWDSSTYTENRCCLSTRIFLQG